MEDIRILEAVERYITGQMNPDERLYFEQLRKTNPEIDQLVVEHTFFLHQLNRFDEVRKLKTTLNDTHIHLAEKGLIKSPKLQGKAKVIYLYNKYKKVAAIAASIAGITALTILLLGFYFSPAKNAISNEVQTLNREINNIKTHNKEQDTEIKNVKNILDASPAITYKTGGTGFLISNKGFVVTNAHVVQGAQNIAVQNNNGKDFEAKVVFTDIEKDITILKITDNTFKAPAIPYSIKSTSTDIGEEIYTLGYPRNDIVYGEGYLAAKTGYDGDTLTCQIAIAANRGNSGSPIINRNGEIIGVLNAKEVSAEGAVFAVRSRYIINALSKLQKSDTTYQNIKAPVSSSLKGLDRTQQVKKISDYVYMVKVN
jgi:S1-C subfamily serine protease